MRGRITTLSVAGGSAHAARHHHRAQPRPRTPETVVGGLVTPLSVAVSEDGTVYVVPELRRNADQGRARR